MKERCGTKGTMRATLVAVFVAIAGCDPAGRDSAEVLAGLLEGGVGIVDLSHALSAAAPYWPGPETSPFLHDTLRAHPDGAPAMAAFSTPEHFGTHLDAPVHWAAGQLSVDRIPPESLFGPAVVVDVTDAAAMDPDYAVSSADLEAWEARNGAIPAGAIVLARTGWASRWREGDLYYNRGGDGRLHFPGFGEDAARFLVEERDIEGIGIDTGSVDPGSADGYPVHELVNGSGRFHLENVGDLSTVPEVGAYLVVAPVKVEGGSGGPVRIFALVPQG